MMWFFPATIVNSATSQTLAVIVFAVCLWLFIRRAQRLENLAVGPFFAAWAAIWLFEYVYLGQNSYVYPDDEGNWVIPFIKLAAANGGNQLSHLIAADHETGASFLTGGAVLTFDGLLLSHLPAWIAIAVHKLAVVTLPFWGIYLLAVRGLGCRRAIAIAFAALITVSTHHMMLVTYATGLSRALIPLACWFAVARLGRPGYWLGVTLYSGVIALCMVPVEGLLPLGASVLAVTLLLGRTSWRDLLTVALAIAVLVVPLIINWADSLYGMMQLAPLSPYARNAVDRAEWGYRLGQIGNALWQLWPHSVNGLPQSLALSSLVVLFVGARPERWRALGTLLMPILIFAAIILFPWERLGLAAIRGATLEYCLEAGVITAPLLGALAAEALFARWPKAVLAGSFAVAVMLLAWVKAHNLLLHYDHGGQSAYRAENLVDAAWAPAEPFRVITLWHKYLTPEQNVPSGFNGLAAFDQYLNISFANHQDYWSYGIMRSTPRRDLDLQWHYWNGQAYELDRQASSALLGLANVRFIISPVPLVGESLRFVDGPKDLPKDRAILKMRRLNDGDNSWKRRIADSVDETRWHFERMFEYGKLYIYEIAQSKPRAYGARQIIEVADHMPPKEFHGLIERHAAENAAVLRHRDRPALPSAGQVTVTGLSLLPDGYDLSVSAPTDGLVLVNISFSPFLSAQCADQALTLSAANGVQTAVVVPAGCSDVRLRYYRPTAWEALAKLWIRH
ncbi:MAG: hypothetical protein FD176_320 [Rhodospirillaceae bacterium]|nr:MAG: hypothetical protein FD176_320 [Rhodospirillaceae bacterium]TNC97431.1 MAG: hypothetical protein FD119_1031 [Stygiobacter sp.]